MITRSELQLLANSPGTLPKGWPDKEHKEKRDGGPPSPKTGVGQAKIPRVLQAWPTTAPSRRVMAWTRRRAMRDSLAPCPQYMKADTPSR